jgi:hypothetical protein
MKPAKSGRSARYIRCGRCRLSIFGGFGDETEKRRVQAAGFSHHLIKPLNIEDLARLFEHRQGA